MKLSALFTLLATASLALTLGACGKSTKTETKYSYDFTENGCPTGLKEFSSVEAMCTSLKDHAANNYCARDLRRQRYIQACPGPFEVRTVKTQPIPPVTPTVPSTSDTTPTPPSSSSVFIVTAPTRPLFWHSKIEGDSVITTLSGTLKIDKPDLERLQPLILRRADSVRIVSHSMGGCLLKDARFWNPGRRDRLEFLLIGEDANTGALSGCLAKLSQLKGESFTVKFTNVPTVGPIRSVVPSLILRVNTF